MFVFGAMLSRLLHLVGDHQTTDPRSLEWSDEIGWNLDSDPQDWIGFNVSEDGEDLDINLEMEGATGASSFSWSPFAEIVH